jgi:FkbM family methyltransferase
LAASVTGPHGKIDAFEPNPTTRRRLEETIKRNSLEDRVTIYSAAASDQDGSIDFGFADDDCQARIRAPGDSAVAQSIVPSIRLDRELKGKEYTLMKMDIEGGEPLALAGMSQMLSQGNPPAMLIEMAGYSRRFGVSTSELISRLDQQGYKSAVYIPERRQLEYTTAPWTYGVENVVAICNTKRDWLESRLLDDSAKD